MLNAFLRERPKKTEQLVKMVEASTLDTIFS